jgi:hypothetical protein
MIINPKIKALFKEVSSQSIVYANTPDKERKYNKRLLKLFKEQLTEEEQLYVVKSLFESLHYKNIVTDPDNVLQLHNLKLRTFMFIFFIVSLFAVLISVLFKNNASINSLLSVFANIFKILNI